MPFLTKKPSHYFPSLDEETAKPLHVGLYLAGTVDDRRLADLAVLGRRIRDTPRPIRCLWLRFREGDESLLDALDAFGTEMVGGATAVQSVVLEGRAGTDEVLRLAEFLRRSDLGSLQLRRTDADLSTFAALRPVLAEGQALRVLNVSSCPGLDDSCVREILDTLRRGGTRLETLSMGEANVDGGTDGNSDGVTGNGVCRIARFISQTPSLTSLTLRLRQLDDVGIGEISLAIRRRGCNVRRLDLSGNFGNSGVEIFAEALKTNASLHTVSFGCYKTFDDAGALALLCAVDPFARLVGSSVPEKDEWENIAGSNHTLRSVYILDRPAVTASRYLMRRLQSITSLDPRRTLQSKCWRHVEKNVEDLSHLGLETRHMPEALAFVHAHGTLDHLYRLIRSQRAPDPFPHPSPEHARLSGQIERMAEENRALGGMLAAERERSAGLREENGRLRRTFAHRRERRCCLPPVAKLLEAWRSFVEVLREPVSL